MFAKPLKTLLTKPVVTNSLFNTLKAANTPLLSTAFLSRSFSSNVDKKQLHTPVSTPKEEAAASGPTVDTIIKKDINLNKFMSKVYRTTGLSIAASLGVGYTVGLGTASVGACLGGGIVMCFGGIFAMSKIAPQIVMERGQRGNEMIEKWKNPLSRQIAYASIISGSGIMMAPFLKSLIAFNPSIIPIAAGLSVLTMGGSSLYAMYKPLGQFKSWESTLYGSLLGLVGMNVISILVALAIGPNIFSLACSKVDLYVGLGLFTAFQAFDTHAAVQAYQAGNYDHLWHSVNFFLNFKNIFLRIAEILAQIKD